MQTKRLIAEAQRAEPETAWMDRPLLGLGFLTWERATYLAIIMAAIVLRFWDLGYRILHHDESIHAVWSWYLYIGRGYRHDPVYHGPFLYHLQAFIYFLIGASDYAARVGPAIFGTIMVGLPYLLRRQLGRVGALSAAFLLMLSPSITYYSRSLRHDIFAAVATLALVVALWRYLDDRQPRWLYLLAGAWVLTFTNHELSYITAFILALYLGVYLLYTDHLNWLRQAIGLRFRQLPAAGVFLLVLVTIVAPLSSAVVLAVLKALGIMEYSAPGADNVLWVTLAVLLAATALVGISWNRSVWLRVAAIFWIPFIVLFTSIFSNPEGFNSGATGALRYWLTQHSFARGGQPIYYYALLFPLYDFLPLVFGLAGGAYALWKRHTLGIFLLYWAVASFAMYSWAGEKMPWLVIHIALPFCILAGWYLGKLLPSIPWRQAWDKGGIWFMGVLALLFAVFLALSNYGFPGAAGMPIQQQQKFFAWVGLFAVWAALVIAGFGLARRLGWRLGWQMAATALLGTFVIFTFRANLMANFRYGDIPVEMLVYTQSTPDVGKVMREIDRIGFRTGVGKEIRVAYDDKVSWPFEWYFRDYTNKNYYGNGAPASDAPIVLVGLEGDSDQRVKTILGNRYVGQRYKLRWWFPEDYKSAYDWVKGMQSDEGRRTFPPPDKFTASPANILRATFSPSGINRLWKYFMYRETLNPLGSTDFMMYVRRDLVDGLWAVTATTGPVAPVDDQQYTSRARVIPATLAIGTQGTGDGQFTEPKGIAVGPDGSIYVADTRNHRIQKFDKDGKFVTKWGGQGSGNGQFNEPWGIAVDSQGYVYVADTWNHRIQKFDKDGKFILTWGKGISNVPGEFYGPRGVTADGQGNIYVTDAGNHRLEKFDSDGKYLGMFGVRGDAEGQFAEPVGVAAGKDGAVYIADTWNQRIQKLDANMKPVGQWPVAGWTSQSLQNKPFLAVDIEGNVYVSDPEAHRMLIFSSTGTVRAVWGRLGTDLSGMNMPTGVALDAAGNVYIADSLNHRVLKFAPVR